MITLRTDIQKLKKLVKTQYDTIDSLTFSYEATKKDRKKTVSELQEAQLKLDKLKNEMGELKDAFSTSVDKLKHEVGRADGYMEEITALQLQVHNLEIRAAYNFGDLTPRPQLKPVRVK